MSKQHVIRKSNDREKKKPGSVFNTCNQSLILPAAWRHCEGTSSAELKGITSHNMFVIHPRPDSWDCIIIIIITKHTQSCLISVFRERDMTWGVHGDDTEWTANVVSHLWPFNVPPKQLILITCLACSCVSRVIYDPDPLKPKDSRQHLLILASFQTTEQQQALSF